MDVACGFMASLEDVALNRKPTMFKVRNCIINLLVYWWWMQRNGARN